MSDNLKLWDTFADIDPAFTKPITGKPYKGTSPNPHYIIRCLTELFGPVGKGFGWEVIADGFQPLGDEVLHWCRIRFWHNECRGFESYGQTKAYMKTRNGLLLDEDAPKKSLTDAVTKAAAQIGVASNIFLGRWDDNKYVAEVAERFATEKKAIRRNPYLLTIVEELGYSHEDDVPPETLHKAIAASMMNAIQGYKSEKGVDDYITKAKGLLDILYDNDRTLWEDVKETTVQRRDEIKEEKA